MTKAMYQNSNQCQRKVTLEDLQSFAAEHSGKCLTPAYTKAVDKYEWECENGHVFTKSWANTMSKKGPWCAKCKWYTAKDLREFAEKKGGTCHTEEYTHPHAKYEWECASGHTWHATWGNVKNSGTWCGECNKYTFEHFQQHAKTKDGKCLKLVSGGGGMKGRYLWECSDGHQWEASGHNVCGNDTWCPGCQALCLQDCINEADKRNGKCLETEYINRRTPMNWECSNGHKFVLDMGGVRNAGQWCRWCHIDKLRLTIEDAHSAADKNGGKCLSTEYINKRVLMLWECSKGHTWKASLQNIRHNSTWCPSCLLKSEGMCRDVLEEMFGLPFIKSHPRWLGLELDGYCEELGLAFEYNGRQHAEVVPFFHRNGEDDLIDQQARDWYKEEVCWENSVTLLSIPHTYTYANPEELEAFIVEWVTDLW